MWTSTYIRVSSLLCKHIACISLVTSLKSFELHNNIRIPFSFLYKYRVSKHVFVFLSLIYLVSCYADLQKYYINVKLSDIYFCIYLHMIRTCSSGLSGHHLRLSPVNLNSFLVIFFFWLFVCFTYACITFAFSMYEHTSLTFVIVKFFCWTHIICICNLLSCIRISTCSACFMTVFMSCT